MGLSLYLDPDADPALVARALKGVGVGDDFQLRRATLEGGGVLLSGLTREVAAETAERLRDAGVHVVIGSDAWHALPAPIPVRAHALRDGALQLRDGYGTHHRVEGSDIALLAAAQVTRPAAPDAPLTDGLGTRSPDSARPHTDVGALSAALATASTTAATSTGSAAVLELFIRAPPRRFQIQAERFHFGGLRGALSASSRENLLTLADELARFAPQASRLPPSPSAGTGQLRSSLASYSSHAVLERACGAALRQHFDGDLSRYPLKSEDAPGPGRSLPAEAEAALLMLHGQGAAARRRALSRGAGARGGNARARTAKVVLIGLALGMTFWMLERMLTRPLPPL